MKKTWKRLCTGFLALATVVTAFPITPVHAESKQYWTESKERVGIVEKVMNTGADVDWYVKAEDIVLKNKGNQNAGSPQNHAPQAQPKK